MKVVSLVLFVLALPMFCYGQRASQDISPAQLQTVIDLPLNQAVKQRETYKAPLKAAYDRQITITGKDCAAEGYGYGWALAQALPSAIPVATLWLPLPRGRPPPILFPGSKGLPCFAGWQARMRRSVFQQCTIVSL